MGGNGFSLEERVLLGKSELESRAPLLESRGLAVPGGEDVVLGLFDDERLVATGALVGSVLQGIAVADGYEGEGAAVALVSSLLKRAVERGLRQVFLYTKPREADRFVDMGFRPVASVGQKADGAALLEWGPDGIDAWIDGVKSRVPGGRDDAGAVVVNCNPFTLGHRRLIEYAAARSPSLYVLVVEEDRSLFPFRVRLELVERGTADIPNVVVLAGGPYVISSATFPTYFVRPSEAKAARAIELHAALDLAIFRGRIAPALGITDRYVGSEPYCATTSVYNRIMEETLPAPGGDGRPVLVHELPRLEAEGAPVSASKVRALIRSGYLEGVRPLVPDTTWSWLTSPEAAPVLERIRTSDSRH